MIRNRNDEYDLIRNIVYAQGYDEQLSFFLCSMYRYMQDARWRGGCHAACSIIYVALTELGYHVDLCLGEVKAGALYFDHSWILLDGKIIDIAVAMIPAGRGYASAPIILDTDIGTNQRHKLQYGIYRSGLDEETERVRNMPFVEYMDNYPKVKDGLWGVLKLVFPEKTDIEELREKYKNTQRNYIQRGE
ncbi:MAG: hypothetical protein K2L82_09820 [Lachnospiraceae bacterium]|nr:hypothetical protein [Lachnospiraceae bacterium]